MSKSMECDIFPFSVTLLVGQEGHPACKKTGCWFVVGDNLTGALHVLWPQLSPLLPSSLASVKPANPGSPGKMAITTKRKSALTLLAGQQEDHVAGRKSRFDNPQRFITGGL